MPSYYFHLRTGEGNELVDEYGDVLADDDAAEEQAVASAKELIGSCALDWRKCSFEVHDDSDRHVVTVWFDQAAVSPPRIVVRPTDDAHA